MTRAFVGAAVATLVVVFSSSLAPAEEANVYPVKDVRPGQKAKGLTVFVGDKVEPFELELLGVVSSFIGPKQDIVVCRLTDPKLQEPGVVAGMSGSPIYVEGKLLGALGYAMGAFMKQGICGITPIGAMREVGRYPSDRQHMTAAAAVADRASGKGGYALAEGLVPIAAPLSISGVDPAVWRAFQPEFERLGFVAVPGGGKSDAETPATKANAGLEAGGAVAAMLVRGDLSIAATGTVTTVDGNQVLAFGHPFLGSGAVSLPMAQSNIITIVPSYNRSFKLGEAGREVGALTQDRLTAIAGELGKKPDVIAVDVEVRSQPENAVSKFHYEVAREQQLTPQLVQMVIANSISRRNDSGPVATAKLTTRLTFADGDSRTFSAVTGGEREAGTAMMAASMSARVFEVLWSHEFGPPSIKRLELTAEVSSEVTVARIDAVAVREHLVHAGESVPVRVTIRRDRQPPKTETFLFSLPDGLPAGEYDLHVGDANFANSIEATAGGPGHPQSYDELKGALDAFRFSGPLFVLLVGKQPSLRVGERLLPAVPLSFQTQIAPRDPDSRVGKTTHSIVAEQRFLVSGVPLGGATIAIKVKAKK